MRSERRPPRQWPSPSHAPCASPPRSPASLRQETSAFSLTSFTSFWSARRVGARRRGRGSAPAPSPARLNRRPLGGAQDEGVPLRQSTPPPPPPPVPIARAVRENNRG